jgi:hypothetical protein
MLPTLIFIEEDPFLSLEPFFYYRISSLLSLEPLFYLFVRSLNVYLFEESLSFLPKPDPAHAAGPNFYRRRPLHALRTLFYLFLCLFLIKKKLNKPSFYLPKPDPAHAAGPNIYRGNLLLSLSKKPSFKLTVF